MRMKMLLVDTRAEDLNYMIWAVAPSWSSHAPASILARSFGSDDRKSGRNITTYCWAGAMVTERGSFQCFSSLV